MPTYKIIESKINNFDTCKILKNRFKKIKKSSITATLNYFLFEILILTNFKESINETINTANGLDVGCFSRTLSLLEFIALVFSFFSLLSGT